MNLKWILRNLASALVQIVPISVLKTGMRNNISYSEIGSGFGVPKTLEKANNFLSTIKFMAEMLETEIAVLDTKVYKRVRSNKEPIVEGQTDYKPTRSP